MESLEPIMPYLLKYSYIGVYGTLVACSFFFPFSKTLIIMAGGILASQNIGDLPVYIFMSIAGLVTADSIYFFLGFLGGEKIIHWRIFTHVKKKGSFQKAEARFKRHDWLAVFSARFVPIIRNIIFLVAGFSRMSPVRFFYADILSALLLVFPASLLGYFFAGKHQLFARYIKEGEFILALLLLLFVGLFFLYHRKFRNN